MKNKKGFVFVETIVTTVVLLSSLLYIYGTYSSMIASEKKRLYYDDISYVYKTQIIKEILEDNISSNFYNVVTKENNTEYLSVFNYGSDIFKKIDSNNNGSTDGYEMLKSARELYNFGQIFYLKGDQIQGLKNCLRAEETDEKCVNTRKRIDGYGDTNLSEYLKKLDVSSKKIELTLDENGESATGIIVVLFYKSKNGSSKVNYGTYDECIVDNYKKQYGESVSKLSQVKSKYKSYFTMQCENAYYISWAYFNESKIS